MAIAFVAADEAADTATSLDVPIPSGTADGHLMLLFAVTADGDDGGFDDISGWTEIVNAESFNTGGSAPSPPGMSVFWKFASSEGANVTVTPTAGSTGICAQILSFSGVAASPFTSENDIETDTGDGSNADPPAITTLHAQAITVVACFHDSSSISSHTVPSGYTDPDSIGRVVTTGGGNGASLGCAYRSSAISSATEEDPGTFTTSSEQWGACTIALRDAAVATIPANQRHHGVEQFKLDPGSPMRFGVRSPVATAEAGLQFVGSASGNSSGSPSADLTSLTGGIDTAAAEDDIVIAVIVGFNNSDQNMAMGTSGYTELADLYSNDDVDANMGVFYKIMGASPDSTATGDDIGSANAIVVHVWRGVDQSTPIDVTTTTATGINSGLANPPAITPVTDGAVILACGHGTMASSTSGIMTTNGMDNFYEDNDVFNHSFGAAISSYSDWESGAYNPAAFGLSVSDDTLDAWCAATVALRPAS